MVELRPCDTQGCSLHFPTLDLMWGDQTICYTYKLTTLEVYSSGLPVYHVFCNINSINENDCAPANPINIKAFLSNLAGSYSGSAITNYLYSVRAWHFVHEILWVINTTKVEILLKGASNLHSNPIYISSRQICVKAPHAKASL